jgi:hypothetical protein
VNYRGNNGTGSDISKGYLADFLESTGSGSKDSDKK